MKHCNQAVATIAVSVSTVRTEVQQLGHNLNDLGQELRSEVQQITHEMTTLSTHIDQRLTASEHRQGQTIDTLTKRIETLEQQPGPRKQRKLDPQQQQQPPLQTPDTAPTPTQLTQKPTPQQLYQTDMTLHKQTHQMLLHSSYRDPTWRTTDSPDLCTKCHHPQREHVIQTCPACRKQSVHKCPPGYTDETDTRAKYHQYYCEKCLQPQKDALPDATFTPCPRCPHAWNNHAYFICTICRMLIQACPHYQSFIDHTAWKQQKQDPL